jgi:anaerobic magnesium-protoporphyrin IX monomethyl ester cyclase
VRHKDRFPTIDLPALQTEVNRNVARLQLQLEGRYVGLLDLMNYVRCDRRFPEITPQSAAEHLTHAESITLNGIYLYQYLTRHGFDVHIIQNFSLADLTAELTPKPLAVCISSNFIYLDEIGAMASSVKSVDPDIPVIVGGLLVKKVLNAGHDLFPQTMNWLRSFRGKLDQFIIEFRGEETLVRSLQTLQAEGDITRVPNLAVFDPRGELHFTRREIEPLDMDAAVVNWRDIPQRYLRKTIPVTTSRGCSFRCKFCTCWKLCPQVHYKSIDTLRAEFRQIQELGFVRHVRFTDDNFTANKNRLRKVLDMMLEEEFTFTWSTYARAGSLTAEMVPQMRQTGCEFVNMGIESGSQVILDNMDKRLDREQVIAAIQRLNAHQIYGEGGFIIGFPGETRETFEESIDLIERSRLPFFQPNLFYYSKEMDIADESEAFDLIGLALTWQHRTMDSAEASALMVEMVERSTHGYHEPQVSVWETFRLLRGEGYSPEAIYRLLGLKQELRRNLADGDGRRPFSPQVESVLVQFQKLVADGKTKT